jgi:hypothetical protein
VSSESRGDGGNGPRRPRPGTSTSSDEASAGTSDETGAARRRPSFEDAFATELESTFGDLGPADLAAGPPASGPRRSSEGGGRRGPSGSGTARRRPRGGGR